MRHIVGKLSTSSFQRYKVCANRSSDEGVMAPGSRGVGAVFVHSSDADSGQTGNAIGEPRVPRRSRSHYLSNAPGLADQLVASRERLCARRRLSGRKNAFCSQRVPDLRESELGLVRYGPASRVHRGVFGPFEGSFPIGIPAGPDKFLAIREFHVVHGCVFFPMCPGSQINLLRVRKTLCASVDNVGGKSRNFQQNLILPCTEASLGSSDMILRTEAVGMFLHAKGRTLVGLGTARSNLGQTSVNPSQTWSTLVKLGQTLGNVSRTFFLGVFDAASPRRIRPAWFGLSRFARRHPRKSRGLEIYSSLKLGGSTVWNLSPNRLRGDLTWELPKLCKSGTNRPGPPRSRNEICDSGPNRSGPPSPRNGDELGTNRPGPPRSRNEICDSGLNRSGPPSPRNGDELGTNRPSPSRSRNEICDSGPNRSGPPSPRNGDELGTNRPSPSRSRNEICDSGPNRSGPPSPRNGDELGTNRPSPSRCLIEVVGVGVVAGPHLPLLGFVTDGGIPCGPFLRDFGFVCFRCHASFIEVVVALFVGSEFTCIPYFRLSYLIVYHGVRLRGIPESSLHFPVSELSQGFRAGSLTVEPNSRFSGHPAGGRSILITSHQMLPLETSFGPTFDLRTGSRVSVQNGPLGVSEQVRIRETWEKEPLGFPTGLAHDRHARRMMVMRDDPDSLVTLRFHDFRVERMRHWWTLLGEDDHADIVGIFGKFPPFMRLQVDRGLLEALASFWDPTHCCFSIGEVDLIPTMEEYAKLLQLDSPFSETPVIPIQGPRSNRCLEKYLGLTTAVLRPEIARPEATWRKANISLDLLTKYFSRSAFPARLARDFIAGKKEWKKFRINAFKIAFAGDRERGSRCSARSSFSSGSAVTCSIFHRLQTPYHFERHTVSQTVQIALPFTGDSRAWALYLLDLPLSGLLSQPCSSSVSAVFQYPPRLGDLDAVTFDYIPGEDMWRLLLRIEDIWGGRLSEMVLIEEGSPGDSSVTSDFVEWREGWTPFFTLRPTVRPGAPYSFDISLPSGISLHWASEREASAARVESLRSTLHHNSVAVANVRRDLVAQRGNVSTLRTMNEFIREQLEISEDAKEQLEENLAEAREQLETEQAERTRVQDELDSLRSYTQALALVDPATGRPQDIVALRRALDASEEALTSARTSMGVMRVQISVLQGDNGVLQSELDLVHDALESNASWLNQEGFPVVTSLHQINQVMDSLGARARAVWEEHDEGDPALSTALGRFCRETCIRLGH
uniref:DUF7745 domain-containing protein n=1 Tax=Fagus sylvatica TaxID=28930 RepID=A0A2N9GWE7_FAGSY